MISITDNIPLISVLIPSFNHERFVTEALDSVLYEDYPAKEIVIIDDGSTDATPQKIEGWIKKHKNDINVKFLKRKINRGLTATLNELVKMSEGEFLVILASDDFLINNGIRKRYEYLAMHSEKKAVIGDCIVVDENGKQIYESGIFQLRKGRKEKYFSDIGLRREVILNWSVPGPVLMIKKEVFEIVGYYDERLQVEDWDFYLRLVARDLLGFIDEKVAAYRYYPGNSTKRFGIRHLAEFAYVAFKNAPSFDGLDRIFLLYRGMRYSASVAKLLLRNIIMFGKST